MNEENKKDDFIMSPKVDFAFKLLFGDPENIELLQALLAAILNVSKDTFDELTIANSVLPRQFKEDKEGILDVRAKTKDGQDIDIEIQVRNHDYMAERSLFYWAKMYTGHIKSGDSYEKLEKCIVINIVDFECIPLNKIHSSYHILEDETHYKLSDALEAHFLELPKLFRKDIEKDENEVMIQWLEFINAKSKEVMQMLATKNEDIQKAYKKLDVISQDEQARAAYLAREMAIHDQVTREACARKAGIKEGMERGIEQALLDVAKRMIKLGKINEEISGVTGLSKEVIDGLRK